MRKISVLKKFIVRPFFVQNKVHLMDKALLSVVHVFVSTPKGV